MSKRVGQKFHSLEDAIIDLYLKIKIRKKDEANDYSKVDYEKEVVGLKGTSPFVILEYIRSTIEILMSLKTNNCGSESPSRGDLSPFDISRTKPPDPNAYEKLLQKAESEVRYHISVENNLKLCFDTQQLRFEELKAQAEASTRHHKEEIAELLQSVAEKQQLVLKLAQEIATLQVENKELTTQILLLKQSLNRPKPRVKSKSPPRSLEAALSNIQHSSSELHLGIKSRKEQIPLIQDKTCPNSSIERSKRRIKRDIQYGLLPIAEISKQRECQYKAVKLKLISNNSLTKNNRHEFECNQQKPSYDSDTKHIRCKSIEPEKRAAQSYRRNPTILNSYAREAASLFRNMKGNNSSQRSLKLYSLKANSSRSPEEHPLQSLNLYRKINVPRYSSKRRHNISVSIPNILNPEETERYGI